MRSVLDELYDSYVRPASQAELQQEIDENHKLLIERLEKPERKLVLRIIDNKDLMADMQARESFKCGFWLAWRMVAQLNGYEISHSSDKRIKGNNQCFAPLQVFDNESV